MYEDVIVTLLGLAVAFFLMIVLVLLIYMWSRINILEKKVGSRAKGREKNQSDKTGGDLLGYRGKEIWDVLQSSSDKERNIDQRWTIKPSKISHKNNKTSIKIH